jgi:hypothetical protein
MPSENQTEASAQIIIVRDSPKDTQTRQIVVYLDGENKGELLFGYSMTLAVAPGAHTLRVDNTWKHQDVQVEIRPGENVQFRTASAASQFSWFLLGFLGFGPYEVSIERVAASP